MDVEAAGVAAGDALGPVGVERDQRGGDGALELRPRQGVGERCQRLVDVGGALEREDHRRLGDLERPPGLDLQVEHPLPELREAVLQLQALAHEHPARGVGAARAW